jgi:hypothetical protein
MQKVLWSANCTKSAHYSVSFVAKKKEAELLELVQMYSGLAKRVEEHQR